jgi:hypothetical protein
MTVPVFPFEEKLASPDGTDKTPRTSISFLGLVSWAEILTDVTNRRRLAIVRGTFSGCMTTYFIVACNSVKLSVLTGM